MGHENEEALFARIPANAAALVRRALSHGDERTAQELLARALEAVSFPKGGVHPLPADLSPAQRAMADLLAEHGDLNVHPFALPGHGETRRRWLGLEPGGALETVSVGGEPLWRALQRAGGDRVRAGEILNTLPMGTLLRAIGEMYPAAYGLHPSPIVLHGRLRVWSELRGEGRDWAIEQAHKWSALAAQRTPRQVALELKALVFVALVRAGVPIEPAWDVLLPAGWEPATLETCLRALPEPRRGPAMAAALGQLPPAAAIQCGLAVLETFPSAVLTEAVLQHAAGAGAPPRRAVVARLREVAKRHPIVADALRAEPEPLELRCAEHVKPVSVLDLTTVQRDQLRLAGRAWDGKDLPAEERLAEDGGETSFAGLVQFRAITDAGGAPVLDALLYMGDSGALFRAGTTDLAGRVVRGGVDVPDPALREALQRVLYSPAPPSERAVSRTAAPPAPEAPVVRAEAGRRRRTAGRKKTPRKKTSRKKTR